MELHTIMLVDREQVSPECQISHSLDKFLYMSAEICRNIKRTYVYLHTLFLLSSSRRKWDSRICFGADVSFTSSN
jgi:hypothetical protein